MLYSLGLRLKVGFGFRVSRFCKLRVSGFCFDLGGFRFRLRFRASAGRSMLPTSKSSWEHELLKFRGLR